MDVEKLPEALTPPAAAPPAASLPFSCLAECVPSLCRPSCSLEVVDELLTSCSDVTGEEADYLLDFRQLLLGRRDAETALRLFCELRRRLEQRHYLAFYRLRRWLENHIVAEIRPSRTAKPVILPLRLNFYCIEPVRRFCLCSALHRGLPLAAPRLGFAFVPLPKAAAAR